MEVCHKGHFQVAGFQRVMPRVEKLLLGTTHNSRSEIHQIGAIANDDGGRRTGTIRIGRGNTVPKYHFCSCLPFFRRLAFPLLGLSSYG